MLLHVEKTCPKRFGRFVVPSLRPFSEWSGPRFPLERLQKIEAISEVAFDYLR